MPEDIKDSSLEESLQLLKDNPPVEPDKGLSLIHI